MVSAQRIAATSSPLVGHTRMAMELLWLLAAFLVPLVFVTPGYIEAEAVIAFVEVPKVTLLRLLSSVMLLLWAIEWALSTTRFDLPSSPREAVARVRAWAGREPGRWVVLPVLALMAVTVLSTLLSAAPRVSILGEVETQDGYNAYTMLSYMVLFLVIATHLKTRPQVMRLIGAVVFSGFLVGWMAILQQYDLEPFDFMKLKGPTGSQISSTAGNQIFAGAVLLLTVPTTLAAALVDTERRWNPFHVGLWVIVLEVQMLGLVFTLARGPWVGLTFALLLFLALGWYALGRASFARAAVFLGAVLAIAAAVALAEGPWVWLGLALVLLLALGWYALRRKRLAKPAVVLAVVAITASAIYFPFLGTQGGSAFAQRLESIPGTLAGGASSRDEIWRDSGRVIVSRPWFAFEDLSFSFLRPLIGYGPDLYRYTMLLESRPHGSDRKPLEADQAHNMLLHQTVELGFLGLAAWLGMLGATFWAGAVRLRQWRHTAPAAQTWILVAIFSLMAGRLLEQMVGISRIGDFTLFWVLLALFASLPGAWGQQSVPAPLTPRQLRRQRRRRSAPRPGINGSLRLWMLGPAIVVGVGLGWAGWVENVQYVQAAVEMGAASKASRAEDGDAALRHVDRAVELAPHMGPYHQNRAQLADAFRRGSQSEERVRQWAAKAYASSLEAMHTDPFSYRTRRAAAVSALTLATLTHQGRSLAYEGKDTEALRLFGETVQMVPYAWPLYDSAAAAYLQLARPEEALKYVETSIALTGDGPVAAEAWRLKGVSLQVLGQAEQAIEALERSLELRPQGPNAIQSHQLLAQLYAAEGQEELAQEHLAQAQALGGQ